MKKYIFLLPFLVLTITGQAQQHFCAKIKQQSAASQITLQARTAALSPQISHELKYDVKFVHLDLNAERVNKRISGSAKTVAIVTAAVLDTFMTLLHQNDTINSLSVNGTTYTPIRQDSIVKVGLTAPLTNGSSFTVVIDYKGIAPNGGSAIGSGVSNAASWYGNSNRATWTLSESLVAYHWWPCKQILTDKIDSSWVFITTDSTNKAGSNGILRNVVTIGNKKRYEWKSRSMIDYYLISIAVSKFKEYNLYAKPQYLPNDSILIQNYIDANAYTNSGWISSDKIELNKMPKTMNFLCNMYGMYPFYKEKYGHCMVALGGGMEHNTMTTIGFFDFYVDAHELGHQWWGDNVTCKSWGDIWINEGFASYTEHLVAQYLDPSNFAGNLNNVHNSVMGQAGGSIYFTNHDTLDSQRIFDSRLTYDKGGAIIHSLRFLTNNDSLWFNTLRGFQNTYKNGNASAVDFKNYYQNATNINPTQFFNQWYYGEGYPTFNIKYNYTGTQCIIKTTQNVSMASVTPLFITPLEYKLIRSGHPDTTILVMHSNPTETYSINLTGTVTAVICDPNNWIINKSYSTRNPTLGIEITENPDGVNELTNEFNSITIGPNPVKETITLNCETSITGKLQLFDINGKFLREQDLSSSNEINLSRYPSGIYLLKLFDAQGKERCTEKIIKE